MKNIVINVQRYVQGYGDIATAIDIGKGLSSRGHKIFYRVDESQNESPESVRQSFDFLSDGELSDRVINEEQCMHLPDRVVVVLSLKRDKSIEEGAKVISVPEAGDISLPEFEKTDACVNQVFGLNLQLKHQEGLYFSEIVPVNGYPHSGQTKFELKRSYSRALGMGKSGMEKLRWCTFYTASVDSFLGQLSKDYWVGTEEFLRENAYDSGMIFLLPGKAGKMETFRHMNMIGMPLPMVPQKEFHSMVYMSDAAVVTGDRSFAAVLGMFKRGKPIPFVYRGPAWKSMLKEQICQFIPGEDGENISTLNDIEQDQEWYQRFFNDSIFRYGVRQKELAGYNRGVESIARYNAAAGINTTNFFDVMEIAIKNI